MHEPGPQLHQWPPKPRRLLLEVEVEDEAEEVLTELADNQRAQEEGDSRQEGQRRRRDGGAGGHRVSGRPGIQELERIERTCWKSL